jgi:hypothetical protein
MVYLRSVKGCTRLDCFHNEDNGWKLNVTHIFANTDSYRKRESNYQEWLVVNSKDCLRM